MNIYELRSEHLSHYPNSHYFDSDTLKFFGEAMSRMKVLKKTVEVTDVCGEKHNCYVVSAIRNKNAFGSCEPYTYYHYFDTTTFDNVAMI